MATGCLTSVTDSVAMLVFSHAGVSSPTSRIISDPNFDTLTFQIANSNRLEVGLDDVIVSANLQVSGNVLLTGAITGPDVLGKAAIQSTYQPLLSSVYDDPADGFHSLLASAPRVNQTKYMASAAGIEVLSTFEGISINCNPCGSFLSTMGFDEMTASAGMISYPVNQWGPTFAAVKQIHTTSVPANTASTAYAEWQLPLGAETCFMHV